MATIKAIVQKKLQNSKGECVVYLRYGHESKTMKISTQVRVPYSNWNEKKEIVSRVSSVAKTKQNEKLIKSLLKNDVIDNTKISEIKSELIAIANSLKLAGSNPDTKTVKKAYLEKYKTPDLNTNDLPGKDELISEYDSYITSINKSTGTKKNYSTTLHHLKEFEKHQKTTLKLSEFTLDTYDAISNFLIHHIKKQDGTIGLADNTVGTSIKNLKTFLKYCQKRGYKISVDLSEIKVMKQSKPIYHLTFEELKKLSSKHFKASRHVKVRDLFVFNCYTGLRYSDLSRLRSFHIQDDVIQMRAYKNQKDLFIPLAPKAKEILTKYDYSLPEISEQKFNKYIKEACEIAEIDSKVEQIKSSSGNKEYVYTPKWKVISSHIAIKTFISICCEKGVSPKIVSEITGKSLKVIIDHYYGIDKKTIKDQIKQAFG
jgi:integrase